MKSCCGSSELIFVVLNFVIPEARYANDVNNRLKMCVEIFVGRKFRDSRDSHENYPLYGNYYEDIYIPPYKNTH